MAVFEGNLKDFMDFIGPLTRNIVCSMARAYKKNTTCRHKGCGNRRPLEAAHIKGKERPVIIGKILESFQTDEDWFIVDLQRFKSDYVNAHTPIEDVILPMCKKHHLEYDKKENIEPEYPILLSEFTTENGDDIYSQEELLSLENNEFKQVNKIIQTSNLNSIKIEIQQKYNLKKSQIAFSRISESNGLWNFDVNKQKFKQDFAFVFYNQNGNNYKVSLVKANSLNTNDFPEKNIETIRFFVDENFNDRSGYSFKNNFL